MIKAIIFDFFDVLRTDAYKAWLQANNIPHTGAYFEASRLQDLGQITTQQFLEKLSTLTGRTVTFEEVDATASIDQEVIEIVTALKPMFKIALLSNAPSHFLRDLLTEHNLANHFDEIIISSEISMVKPDAEIFYHTLKKLDVNAKETLFIDDNPNHTQAAEHIGITAIQFSSAKQLKKELRSVDILI